MADDPATAGRPAAPRATPSVPFLTEPQRALRAVFVGVALGAVLAALARRA